LRDELGGPVIVIDSFGTQSICRTTRLGGYGAETGPGCARALATTAAKSTRTGGVTASLS
jgi:hypothetical protein